jgi:hypothetical protein
MEVPNPRVGAGAHANLLEPIEHLCAVESTWSSCLPFGNTVSSCRYSASHAASFGRWTNPFSIIAVWACMRMLPAPQHPRAGPQQHHHPGVHARRFRRPVPGLYPHPSAREVRRRHPVHGSRQHRHRLDRRRRHRPGNLHHRPDRHRRETSMRPMLMDCKFRQRRPASSARTRNFNY